MTTLSNGRGPLIKHLDEIRTKCIDGDPTLKDVVSVFGPDGHYVLMLFLIIPFLQPVPLPGLSTPFGILMTVIATLSYFNKPPWLPKKWGQRKISAKTLSRIGEGSERVFQKLARILHPRWRFLFQEPCRTLSAMLLIFNAVLLALPLPIPFSNAIPAWAILFQTLAHLEEDGLFIIFSYAQTILCLLYFFVIVRGAWTGLESFGLQ
jgi:hypothetical protein